VGAAAVAVSMSPIMPGMPASRQSSFTLSKNGTG
jgi:hypothetical protein